VAAASMTSQTLMRWHIIANSFTEPMLIIGNVFSRSFTISATFVELSGTAFSRACESKEEAHLGACRRDAADDFWNYRGVMPLDSPGSIRSEREGQKEILADSGIAIESSMRRGVPGDMRSLESGDKLIAAQNEKVYDVITAIRMCQRTAISEGGILRSLSGSKGNARSAADPVTTRALSAHRIRRSAPCDTTLISRS
jgi:hypothetical protein